MANTTEFWKSFNDRLLFMTLRNAAFQGIANPSWFAELQAGARDFRISRINADNVAVGDVTEDQLAAAATFNTATLTGQDVTRNLFRGTAQVRMLETFESQAGAALVSDVLSILAQKAALHLDGKIASEITSATFNTTPNTAGEGFDLGKIGTTGANGTGISISYKGMVKTGTASDTDLAAFTAEIADLFLRAQEYWQDSNLRGTIVGDGAPVRFAAFTLPGVGAALNRSEQAKAMGFRAPSDVGAQLMTTLNLMGGMGAFQGMLNDTAIYTVSPDSSTLAKPTAADGAWPIYFVPVGSAIAFASQIWRSDRIAGPLPNGEMLDRWITVGRYAVESLKTEHLIKATINAKA